jgi:hypothetical protein
VTADEDGLPPLDPDAVQAPAYDTPAKIMRWLVETVWALDIEDERRKELDEIFENDRFLKIANELAPRIRMGLDDPESIYGEPPPLVELSEEELEAAKQELLDELNSEKEDTTE